MRMGRTICTNSNIVIKYEYNFMSPSDIEFCFMIDAMASFYSVG